MNKNENNPDQMNFMLQRTLIALSVAGTFMVLAWLLKYSAYGLDFTDEGFYLVWISNPFIYSTSITQFGFIYHPLYSLLGGDIAGLRQVNILITFSLAWFLVHVYLISLAPDLKKSRDILLTVSAGLATSTFVLFDSWLLTPSYNSLALQSLLISAIGLILAEKTAHLKSMIGWLLIGIGGWLSFMAKPSTALAMAIAGLVILPLSHKFSCRLFLLSVASTLFLLLASALLIDGSVLRFIERLHAGSEYARQLGSRHNLSQIFRIDSFALDIRTKFAILLVSFALFIAMFGIANNKKKWRFVSLLILFTFFLYTALHTLGQIHRPAGLGKFQGLVIFAVASAALLVGLVIGQLKALKTISPWQWIVASLFLIMPHIYAFGTTKNYWRAANSAAIFWLLAGLILLGPLVRQRASWLVALPLAIATQAITVTLLQAGLEHPYRQPQPLRLNASTLDIGPQRSTLVLSEGHAKYISNVTAAAQEGGLEPNTPVIDLSGQSPGVLYALGAESLGQAWLIGGYPGSQKFAESTLALTSCEKIANAWILLEQDGPRSIPTGIMYALGADFPRDYKQVGSWQTAERAGGYAARRIQELYKPTRPKQTLLSCQMLRAKGIQ